MSGDPSPRELAELTVRRLNRASSDLGLTLGGRPLFALQSRRLPDVVDDRAVWIDVFDVELNAIEFEDYNKLATMLEQFAERQVAPARQPETVGQQNLFELNRLT